MSKLVNILSDLQGKKVKIDGKTQIIILNIQYSLKYNSTTAEITFNEIQKMPLGRHLMLKGYVYGCGKTLNDALYFLFNEPSAKELTNKQQRVIDNIIKKNNKNK